MLTIDIEKIEKVTGLKVRRNFRSLGLDLASTSGYCVSQSDGKKVALDCGFCQFGEKIGKDLYKHMHEAFKDLIPGCDLVVIEATYYGNNADVVIKLSRFGGMAISNSYEGNAKWEMISAVSARSKIGINSKQIPKGKAKEYVANFLKEKFGIELGIENNDAADGVILSILGLLEGLDFRSKTEIAKEKKEKKGKK